MIKESIGSIWNTTRALFSNRASLAIFAGLYVLFLAALYGFIATREATIWQILLTLLFLAAAPVLFFLLQAAIINHARAGRFEWSRVLRDSTKFALLALPVIFIGLGVLWLLNRWQAHFPAPPISPGPLLSTPAAPMHLPTVLFATLRALIFGVALPLTLIQLWVEAAGHNLFVRIGGRAFLSRLGQIFARAFAPRSVVIYMLGLLIFGLLPYVLVFIRIPLPGAWSEMSIFTARLILVFLFILLGWVIMLSTFAKVNENLAVATAKPNVEEPV
jgi:hypothetical protein